MATHFHIRAEAALDPPGCHTVAPVLWPNSAGAGLHIKACSHA